MRKVVFLFITSMVVACGDDVQQPSATFTGVPDDPKAPLIFCDVNPDGGVLVRQNCPSHTNEALPCKVCNNFSHCRTSLNDPPVEGVKQAVYCVNHYYFQCEDPHCRVDK